MLHRIREHFGTAGLLVAIAALVAALAGTAFAATKLNSTQKKEVKSIAKSFQGKGPAGAKGDPGAAGTAGAPGAKGDAGSNGSSGTSATTESFNGALHGCTEGGVVVKSASPEAIVCNGKKGTNGEDGETGFTETLPPEKTETGTWSFESNGTAYNVSPISFPIPLAATDASQITVHYWRESDVTHDPECTGTIDAPDAEPGVLCMYIAEKFEADNVGGNPPIAIPDGSGEPGVGTNGAVVNYESVTAGKHQYGTFAITAPFAP
jgi:hypothetical protein